MNVCLNLLEESCLTISGHLHSEMCDFPFEYNGVTYNECTWDWPPLLERNDARNVHLNEILDFEDESDLYTEDAGAWCMYHSKLSKTKNDTFTGRGKCGPNCPIPSKPEGIWNNLNSISAAAITLTHKQPRR